MKRTFVKPEISSYNIQAVHGQDSLDAVCATGSYPESKPPIGACYTGTAVGIDYSCLSGGSAPTPNVCKTGNGVIPSICSVGDFPV